MVNEACLHNIYSIFQESESAAEESPTAVKDRLHDELQYEAPRAADEGE